jgi:hypothetical protein
MDKQVTILEEIIADVGRALYQKWMNALPEDQKGNDELEMLSSNASETAIFVIKMFMDKFNEAAEELQKD